MVPLCESMDLWWKSYRRSMVRAWTYDESRMSANLKGETFSCSCFSGPDKNYHILWKGREIHDTPPPAPYYIHPLNIYV